MSLPEGAIINESGQVAMRYMQQADAYVNPSLCHCACCYPKGKL